MTTESMLAHLHARRSDAATLVVRHVGALVATRTTLRPEQLAAGHPIGETHDAHAIGQAFDAIASAEPSVTSDTSEGRWHLTFLDRAGKPIAVVTTAVFAPRHGTIDGTWVLFHNDRLVRWLAHRYAPNEIPLIHD
ncbi:MAG: hypothetical protein IAI50_08935 [Candidatus Eremiobacteraeota bacterium]|nr:hypothetical protein [Candidatus Eremiobacteraeota bacterium]